MITKFTLSTLTISAALGFAATARAATTTFLTISDGNSTIVVNDEDFNLTAPDGWVGVGDVFFSTIIGDWDFYAYGNLEGSSPGLPHMMLNWGASSSLTGGSLTISFSNQWMEATNALALGTFTATLPEGTEVVYSTSSPDVDVSSLSGAMHPGDPTFTVDIPLHVPQSYTLTQTVTISHEGRGISSGAYGITTSAVPDAGTTVGLLGFAMCGLESLRRRLARK